MKRNRALFYTIALCALLVLPTFALSTGIPKNALMQAWEQAFRLRLEARGIALEEPKDHRLAQMIDPALPVCFGTRIGAVYVLFSADQTGSVYTFQQLLSLTDVEEGQEESTYAQFRAAMECAILTALPGMEADMALKMGAVLCDDFAAKMAETEPYQLVLGAGGMDFWVFIAPVEGFMSFNINPEQ